MIVALAPLLAALAAGIAPSYVTLDQARQLYAAAAYDEALVAFDQLRKGAADSDAAAIDTYRASCLLALNRGADAEAVLAELVELRPAERTIDAAPKVQAIFERARDRALPDIARSRFERAKRLFDDKNPAAAAAFDEVIALLQDPVFDLESRRAAAADLRTISAGYAELSRRLASAAPAAKPPASATAASAVSTPGPAVAADRLARRVFRSGDADVAPPVALFQPMNVTADVLRAVPVGSHTVRMTVTVSERGTIESAALERSVNPIVDAAFIGAVKTWKYKPARRNGAPVAYTELIELRLP